MTEKLADCLFALASFKNRLEPALAVMKRYVQDEDLKWTMSSYMLLTVHGFLEEWRIFNRLAGTDPSVRRTCEITSAALKRIKSWPGLEPFRNSVLAHTTRTKEGTLTDIESLLASFKIPRHAETMLMAELANLSAAVALRRHTAVYERALREKARLSTPDSLHDFGIKTKGEFISELHAHYSMMIEAQPDLAELIVKHPWP
ncbi:hypothetical protein GOC22_19570 [Sinorhizobium meliloti]|nr:hypothetical protein [Sinorhizobium meliloti]